MYTYVLDEQNRPKSLPPGSLLSKETQTIDYVYYLVLECVKCYREKAEKGDSEGMGEGVVVFRRVVRGGIVEKLPFVPRLERGERGLTDIWGPATVRA